jgi:hypothetical protein
MLAAAAVLAGCDTCGQPGRTWTVTRMYAGDIEAPADLGLPAQFTDGACTGGFSDGTNSCMQDGVCTPSFCLSTAGRTGTALYLQLTVVASVDGPVEITLPAANVVVTATAYLALVSGGTEQTKLTVASGVVQILSLKPTFDALVNLTVMTPDGRPITITGARYTHSNGHYDTYCGAT